MKLASYRHAGRDSYGLVVENGIIDLARRFPEPDLRSFIEQGQLAKVSIRSVNGTGGKARYKGRLSTLRMR